MTTSLGARHRRTIFAVHLFAVGVALSSCAWIVTDRLKELVLERVASPVFEWAFLFHNPSEAALVPYAVTALVAFGYGLFLYVGLRRPAHRLVLRLRRAACARHASLLVAVVVVQPLLFSSLLPHGARILIALLSPFACVVRGLPAWVQSPLHELVRARRSLSGAALRWPKRGVGTFCALATLVVLVLVGIEPVKLVRGPTRLLNEYRHLPERTLPIGGGAPFRGDEISKGTDAIPRCKLSGADRLECSLQYMSRGQINHIGHVLNPINEVLAGKPVGGIYFQYGLGATFLFKRVMDLFGGPSLQAYYKSALFYLAYWLVFAAAAVVLFRDARYVLASVMLLAVAYYAIGYHALILAPGINPILHFLDLPVLLASVRLFRTGRTAPLVLGAAGAVAAVAINGFFGLMVAAAFLVSCSMYFLENVAPSRRLTRIAALAALVTLPLAALALVMPRTGGSSITSQFLSGFFSWRPPALLVFLSVVYLAGSYLVLLWTREQRTPLKYAFVFLFVYAQGFLTYFYWSGLTNHFWPALPYVGLHLLLAMRILGTSPALARWEPRVLAAAILALGLGLKVAVGGFIGERAEVREAFATRETHRWPFPRARVIATADPAPLAASVEQIERHAGPVARGICILSVFDNLVPFLAERNSILPHFEVQWWLITDREHQRAVEMIASARPPYLFVGREVEDPDADRWPDLFCGGELEAERKSARGRIREMNRVFVAVAADYERIESGPLLSVYRRRDARP